MHRAATNITELYAPQFEQFGLELTGKGTVFTGEVANDRAHGRAWIMPLSPACVVMEHFITPTHDMYLAEYTPEPYACVSEVSAPTLTCMPEAGITPANLKPLHGPWPNNAVCSFIQDSCGEELSPLFAGELYHSRSVLFCLDILTNWSTAIPPSSRESLRRLQSHGTRKRRLPSATRCAGLTRTAPVP